MDVKTILFIGKPGCGKDTQAELLSKATGWPVISAGDQFRALALEDTLLGHKVKREVEAGELAPDWLAMHLYLKSLFELPEDASIIFDGFSREVSQAKLITKSLTWLERPFTVVAINVSDETVRARLGKRGEVSGRVDDSTEVVEERLKEYYAATEPAISYFREQGNLIEIDGEPPILEIAERVRAALSLA
jgi:adenylate kinase